MENKITIIRNHRLQHGNITDGIDGLMAGNKADIFYSDPPWNQGNIKYWRTLNYKHNDIVDNRLLDYNNFFTTYFEIVKKYAKDIIFIESGRGNQADIKSRIEKLGYAYFSVEILYSGGVNILNIGAKNESLSKINNDYLESLHGGGGLQLVMLAIKPFVINDGILLDCCCGLGYSAISADKNNMRFYGNELNKSRLETCKKRLENGNSKK